MTLHEPLTDEHLKPGAIAFFANDSLRTKLTLILVLLVSALIQLTVVSKTEVEVPLRADAGDYISYAFNMQYVGMYSRGPTWSEPPGVLMPVPDKLRSPGYPLFLAAIGPAQPTKEYLRKVSVAQALLGVLSVGLLFLISRSFLGPTPSLVAAAVMAANPHFATISTYLLSESLFVFCLLLSTLALIKAFRHGRTGIFAVSGLLWGLCSLVRPTVQFIPILLCLIVFALPSLKQYRKQILYLLASFLLAISPWHIRNLSIPNQGASLMVMTIAHGSYPNFRFEDRKETFREPYRYDPAINAITKDLPSILTHLAGKFRDSPSEYAYWYLIGKPRYFLDWAMVQGFDVLIYPVIHTPYYEDGRFVILRWLCELAHWPLMILGLIGAFLAVLRPKTLALDDSALLAARVIALLVAYAIVFHMIAAPFPRYGIPFRPFLYALALLPILAIFRKMGSSFRRKAP